MKASEMKSKSVDELSGDLTTLRKEQFNLRFQRATGQLENTSRVRVIRRDIARIKTIARQKRVGEPAPKRAAEPKQKAAAAPKAKRAAAARPKKAAKSKSK